MYYYMHKSRGVKGQIVYNRRPQRNSRVRITLLSLGLFFTEMTPYTYKPREVL